MTATIHPMPVLPAPDTTDPVLRIATDLYVQGYATAEIGPFLSDFGVSPEWKTGVSLAMAALEAMRR
jgi:hypothetical protein